MAERVDAMPKPGGGATPKYPWDEWFDGSAWELVQGKDFEIPTANIRTVIKSAARRRKLNVTVTIRGDRVYIQAQR